MVVSGHEKLGYDLGLVTSLGLVSWMVPVFRKVCQCLPPELDSRWLLVSVALSHS